MDIIRVQTLEILRQRLPLQDKDLVCIADAIITDIQEHFSGEHVYFPRLKYDRQKVLADFNGRNRKEVCRMHGISRSTFFNIIGSERLKK